MSGIIRIDMPKGVQAGSTSVSPQSPSFSAVSSPSISPTGTLLLGYSAMAAKSTISTVVQEIRAGGNEELATSISNTITGVGIVTTAIATQGLSLIPLGISTAAQAVSRDRANARENRSRQYEESMRGSRVSYMSGGGYE